ncbi:MAG: putative Ig domain-containing protein [Methylovulum sp.]
MIIWWAIGNDVYVFNRGDGQDYIDNYDVTAASDTLHFGEGIADTDILAFQSGSSLLLKIKDRADTITIAYYYDTDIINGGGAYDHKIDRVEFANGVVWDQTILQTQVNRSLYNQVPVVSNEIPALNAMAGDQLTYQVPINTITDLDIWDTIHYSAELEDGSPLPSWLQFDADTRTFSGVPTETGILQLLVWGIDDYGYGVGENFTLNIQSGSNIAPVLSLPVPDQAVNEGEIFSYTLPENTFIDANGNNTLSYSITLTDAGSLPSWLSFNTGTFTFYGASPVGTLGTFSIKITAIDSGHVMVSDIFDLQINIQDLTLNGTDNADMLLGRSGNDSLIAGAGNDTLNGSAGGDALTGGSGDDTYVIDNKLDLVTEYANEGIDQINSSVSYDLPDEVENIVLTGGLAINSTGNTLDNLMIGNDARNILFGVVGADTMIGGLGNDTYGVNNVGDVVVETSTLAAEIDEVISSIDYLLGDNLEDLILNGDAAINGTGNTLNNEIIGNAANNVLDGSTGADTLVGDLGNDTYIIDNNSDVVTEISTLATEVDTVLSSVSYTLDANTENLSLTGTSSINGTGNELSNIIIGNINNNVLDGGASTDTLLGSLGDDVYNVDNIRDKVVEVINEGVDQVNSSVSFTLSANTENLTLTGSVAINGTGNSIANNMTGNSGDNILAGGEGADILNGGGGNDTYVVNITALGEVEDTIVAGSGIDTLELVNDYYTGPRIALTLAAAIENYNIARTRHAYLDMIGNSEDNILTGNKADNTLDGGTGEDILAGGLGNDFYLVDKSGDVIIEEVGEGTDQVNSSVSYALPVEVEMLTLTGSSLTSGTGNEQANTIVGNSNDNTLDGRTGGDNLIGGLGNDVYMVDNASDVVIEYMNGGNDQVNSSISYTLSEQLENLTLVDAFDINGTGNDLINVITGNGGGNILSGGAGNDVLSGGSGIDTLIGGLGDDSYIVDNTSDVVIETANEGADQVSSSVTYTLSTEVESLTLTGSSAINGIGNNLANSITGNSGGNILTGGASSDTLTGGGGSDTYVVNLTAVGELEDAVVAGTGIDTLKLLGNYLGSTLTLMTAISIEHVDVSGTGSSLLDLTGNMTNNTLTGNAANNILDGAAGNDTLLGGLGNDNYLVDSSADIVTEAASAGADTVQSIATSYILGSNVENLVLTGAGNTSGSGNSLVNVITGNIGNNILSGGSGADTLVGGLGNDIYIVDNASDVVIETANEGADQISSSVTYTLSTEVESLTLTGSSAINGIGNNLANSITGNSGGNILTGGAGSDTLTGGGGSDTYVVNLTALGELEDAVVAGTGIDTLKLLGSYTGQLITLTAATAIENYDIAGTGSALLNLTGSTSNNTLTGNSGSNILIGGAGTDTLRGSGGTDTYIVNITAVGTLEDTVIAGADTLQLVGSYSGASITLTAATAIENYDISGTGGALLNLTGNTSNNSLIGNSSDNTFKGLAGNDVLTGGNGADTFWFDTAANSLTNKDTLTDFATGVDKLKFSLSALSALGLSGQFSAGDQRFNQSSNGLALDATDRLIYNTTTGELNYDSNGNVAGGTQAALLILNGLPNLADTDIFAV